MLRAGAVKADFLIITQLNSRSRHALCCGLGCYRGPRVQIPPAPPASLVRATGTVPAPISTVLRPAVHRKRRRASDERGNVEEAGEAYRTVRAETGIRPRHRCAKSN